MACIMCPLQSNSAANSELNDELITVMLKILTSSFSCIKQQLGSAAASPVIFVKFYIAKETILFAKEQ